MEMAAKKQNGGFESFKRIVAAISIVLIAGWVGWISVCATSNKERISVIENGLSYIRYELMETKSILKDIRQDQIQQYQRVNR